MSNQPKLDRMLKRQSSTKSGLPDLHYLLKYAEFKAKVENVVVVVSDLGNGTSHIYSGRFGALLGVGEYDKENSIWEKVILNMMTDGEREEKFLAELRFFNFLRHVPSSVRADYHMASKLRIKSVAGEIMDVMHRMYYVYADDSDAVCYAVCTYGRVDSDFAGKSIVVNSVTGVSEELTSAKDSSILSKREHQVLMFIDSGMTSADIARTLSISKHTVSRHRQEILAKLRAKNSVVACRIAKAMGI